MKNKSAHIGAKTQRAFRIGNLDVQGKDPNMEYSARPRKELEEGGGVDSYGYEPITGANNTGESWGGVRGYTSQKTKGPFIYMDTILCKRPKFIGDQFRTEENMKYNAQINLVRTASKRIQGKLREIDAGGRVTDDLKTTFTQRTGPTEGTDKEE